MEPMSDERLKSLFAQAPEVAPDEAFVVEVAANIRARRRWKWLLMGLGLIVFGVGLALIAVLTPMTSWVVQSPVVRALLQLPGFLTGGVRMAHASVQAGSPWVVVAVALPLAGTLWLTRGRV